MAEKEAKEKPSPNDRLMGTKKSDIDNCLVFDESKVVTFSEVMKLIERIG